MCSVFVKDSLRLVPKLNFKYLWPNTVFIYTTVNVSGLEVSAQNLRISAAIKGISMFQNGATSPNISEETAKKIYGVIPV